jgi:hypothetical protein
LLRGDGDFRRFAGCECAPASYYSEIRSSVWPIVDVSASAVWGGGPGGFSASFASRAVDLINQSYRRSISPARSHHLQPLGRTKPYREILWMHGAMLDAVTIPLPFVLYVWPSAMLRELLRSSSAVDRAIPYSPHPPLILHYPCRRLGRLQRSQDALRNC